MGTTDAAFAGSIPAIYEQYLGPLLFEPFAEDIAARLHDIAQGRILETATGTGIVTRALVKALPPNVEIVATDLNQAMLDVAAKRLQAPNVKWQQADAQSLPFEDTSFDVIVCQFGVMFFPDKLTAAGFENVDIEVVEKVSRAPSSREPATGLCQGSPLRLEIEARAPERLEDVTAKVADALTARFGTSEFENRMSALVVTAWR
jgi:SAM-dependent methyltransferase